MPVQNPVKNKRMEILESVAFPAAPTGIPNSHRVDSPLEVLLEPITCLQTLPSLLDADIRLARVNTYFRMKAAEVISDEKSVRLIARLYETREIQYSDMPVTEQGVALARLASAGFCELEEEKAQMTDSGRQFILGILQS